MANIYDVANEPFSDPSRDLPEYKAVVESKQAIEANSEAKTLFDEYVAFQNQLQGLMQSGQLPTEAATQEMKDYMEKIQASPIVNEFFTKQQQLFIYLADLEKDHLWANSRFIQMEERLPELSFRLWYFRSPVEERSSKKLGNIRFLFQIFDQEIEFIPNYDRIWGKALWRRQWN